MDDSPVAPRPSKQFRAWRCLKCNYGFLMVPWQVPAECCRPVQPLCGGDVREVTDG